MAFMVVEHPQPLDCCQEILLSNVMLCKQEQAVEIILPAKISPQVFTPVFLLHLHQQLRAFFFLLVGQQIQDQQRPGTRRIPGKKEGLPLPPNPGGGLTMDIENPAALVISKDVKSLYEKTNPMFSPLPTVGVLVRMGVENQPSVCPANIFRAGALAEPQDVVVVQLMPEVRGILVAHSIASAGARQVGAVQHYGDRAIIVESDVHMGSEYSLAGADST